MNILPLITSYICFAFGGSPVWLYIPMLVFMGIGGNIVIVYYAHKECNLSIKSYFKEVLIPVIITGFIMLVFGIIPILMLSDNFIRLILCALMTTSGMAISFSKVGMTSDERSIIINIYHRLSAKLINR